MLFQGPKARDPVYFSHRLFVLSVGVFLLLLQFYVARDASMDALRGCEVETALFLA